MANPKSAAMQQLPLHITATILTELDSFQQLGSAILSHRMFLHAFNDKPSWLLGTLILKRCSRELLPFVLALYESTQIDVADPEAVHTLMTRLKDAILDPTESTSSLYSLPVHALVMIGKSCEAIDSLIEDYVDETIPVLNARLDLNQACTISQDEAFRLRRAFLRYQLMCNLFCSAGCNYITSYRLVAQPSLAFFDTFSPWVNEQLVCVYVFLERKVSEAHDYLAAHDVDWGQKRAIWQVPGCQKGRVQELLCQGLRFLSSVSRAKSYDQRASLLQPENCQMKRKFYPHSCLIAMKPRGDSENDDDDDDDDDNPDEAVLRRFGLTDEEDGDTPICELGDEVIKQLPRTSDGKQDSVTSGPYRAWMGAHCYSWVGQLYFCDYDINFWECGYVIWDYLPSQWDHVYEQCKEVRDYAPLFPPFQHNWPSWEVELSQQIRELIHESGGHGYWPRPRDEPCFSDIKGVRKEYQEFILHGLKKHRQRIVSLC